MIFDKKTSSILFFLSVIILHSFCSIGQQIADEVQFSSSESPKGYKKRKKDQTAMFQGNKERKEYFEGWYFKMVSKDRKQILSVIPGISLSKVGIEQHAFIQIINGSTAETYYFRFPIEDFYYSASQFTVRIGDNYFSRDQIRLDLLNDSTHIKGEIDLSEVRTLPDGERIMGWYSSVPFMQCYHGVVSLDHDLHGEIHINNEDFNFDNGDGYIEKDWGKSMPSSWIWIQTNSFTIPGSSFMLSVANIPWLGKSFTGFLGFFLKDGEVEKFGTYSKANLSFEEKANGLSIIIKTKERVYSIKVTRSESGLLAAPVNGSMDRRISESVNAKLFISVSDHQGMEVYRDSSSVSGLEIVGDLTELSKIK